MKKLFKLYMDWIQTAWNFKLVISVIIFMFFGVLYNNTQNDVYLWLMIIPGTFLVPYMFTPFVILYIIRPIYWLINKFKK